MNTCLNCGKEVAQTEGRRARLYCSASCRQKKWQYDQREIKKLLLRHSPGFPVAAVEINGTIRKVKNKALPAPKSEKPADAKEKKQEVTNGLKLGVKVPLSGNEQSVLKGTVSVGIDRESVEKQITAVKAEKIPENRSKSTMGIKSWNLDQKKRIQELENQLK